MTETTSGIAVGDPKQKVIEAPVTGVAQTLKKMYEDTVVEVSDLNEELYNECYPSQVFDVKEGGRSGFGSKLKAGLLAFLGFIYVPHFPLFHRPGWLVKILVGPYDGAWGDALLCDFLAGLTVAMTLIPQALSYATLANQPPISGLYASVLPCVAYVLLGSSMTLALGPVAIVGLLTGSLVSKYEIDVASAEAVDFASECCLVAGTILLVMSLLNLGNFIRFISHPVMSGFTTAAAMLIGLNQIKGAFGFKAIDGYYPQTGDGKAHYNYEVMEWLLHHFNDEYSDSDIASADDDTFSNQAGNSIRNPYAAAICFGLYVPLIINQTCKKRIKATPARKASWLYKAWIYISNMQALIAVIIGAGVAYSIKKNAADDDFYAKTLKIVGDVPAGLDILRVPSMKWDFFTLLPDVLPLTLIAFMESYSIAKKTATMRGELHTLSPSQELFAVGMANISGALSSAFPVAGSYSRSSINFSAGARSPLSKTTTLLVVVLALQVLTESFYYIPYGALSAIIWVGITNLIDVRDFWNAWKYSKKDFVTMTITWLITLVFETSIGLAVGLLVSILFHLGEVSFSEITAPHVVHRHENNHGVLVVRLESDMTFLTSFRTKDLLVPYSVVKPLAKAQDSDTMATNGTAAPVSTARKTSDSAESKTSCHDEEASPATVDIELGNVTHRKGGDGEVDLGEEEKVARRQREEEESRILRQELADERHRAVSAFFDLIIPPPTSIAKDVKEIKELPKAIILDFSQVHLIDITGLHSVAELCADARGNGTLVAIVNTSTHVTQKMIKFGITSDISDENVNIDEYVLQSNMVDDEDDDIDEGMSLLRRSLPIRAGGGNDVAKYEQLDAKLANIDAKEGSPVKAGTGQGIMMRVHSREMLTSDDGIDVNRSPSESALVAKAPTTDEMLAVTHSHPVARSDSTSAAGDEKGRSADKKKKKEKPRTHREKYGIIDGARLPATRNRSSSHDSGAGSEDDSIAVKRSLSLDRKDLGEDKLKHLLRGLSYDHNA